MCMACRFSSNICCVTTRVRVTLTFLCLECALDAAYHALANVCLLAKAVKATRIPAQHYLVSPRHISGRHVA